MVNDYEKMNDYRGPAHACPYLGLFNDPDSYWPEVSKENRCHALGMATSVDDNEQRTLCLGGGYPACPRFLASPAGRGMAPIAPRQPANRGILGSPITIVVGGGLALVLLLACTIGLVLYQTSGFGRAASGDTPNSALPAVVETETPLPTDTPEPSATPTVPPSPTLTIAPTRTATVTRVQTPVTNTLAATPARTSTLRPPTQPPTARPATARPTTPYRSPTPYYTPTPYRTSTPRATYTVTPTRTITPTRSPTPIPYGVALTAGQTSQTLQAGQTVNFDASMQNLAQVSDTFSVQIFPAVLGGWTAKLFVNGADQGQGPVTVSVAAQATQPITVKIGAAAGAAAGDAGEVILTATSNSAASATDSITLSVSVVQ